LAIPSAIAPLSGLAATWGWRRSGRKQSEAGAVLGGQWTSGLLAVCRDLKLISPQYPVGDGNAGWDRVAVTCGSSAIDIAGMDHDEPSGSARAERMRQTGIDRGSWHGRCRPTTHFIGDAAIGAASGHRGIGLHCGRVKRTGRCRGHSARRERQCSDNHERARPSHRFLSSHVASSCPLVRECGS
jgi:hypothetical protein